MPYFTITDFAAGLDLGRSELTAPAGTLRSMINCHITPGGEIEKRMAFVPFWECSPESRGLVEVNQKLYTFGPNGPYKTEPPDGVVVGRRARPGDHHDLRDHRLRPVR